MRSVMIGIIWIFVLGPFTGPIMLPLLLLDPTGITFTVWAWVWVILHIIWFDGSKYQKAL